MLLFEVHQRFKSHFLNELCNSLNFFQFFKFGIVTEGRNCFKILIVSDSEVMYYTKLRVSPRETDKLYHTRRILKTLNLFNSILLNINGGVVFLKFPSISLNLNSLMILIIHQQARSASFRKPKNI